MHCLRLLACFVLTFSTVAVASSVISDIPLPSNTEIKMVGRDVVHNGQVSSIAEFSSDLPVQAVMDFYQALWESPSEEPGYLIDTIGNWSIISKQIESEHVVLQVRDTPEGASGFLSSMDLDVNALAQRNTIPIPDSGQTVSLTDTHDYAGQAQTLIVKSTESVSMNIDFYKKVMQRGGWQINKEFNQDQHRILFLNKRNKRCEILVSEYGSGESIIFVNEIDDDGSN